LTRAQVDDPPVVQTSPPAAPEAAPGASAVPPASAPQSGAAPSAPARSEPPPARQAPAGAARPASAPRGASRTGIDAAPGSLLIRSTPAGAHVTIDGRQAGQTPLAIRELAPGTHAVRVSREGFVAQERRVVLSPTAPAQSLEIELLRETDRGADRDGSVRATAGRFTAPLLVESRPSGASVFLDGKAVGTTPLMIPDVPAGTHVVRLELADHQRWTASVRVVAGERNRVAASLEQ
jgi:hypothetical protein